jgi:hypothetical protein
VLWLNDAADALSASRLGNQFKVTQSIPGYTNISSAFFKQQLDALLYS